jgi:hypothetical protein
MNWKNPLILLLSQITHSLVVEPGNETILEETALNVPSIYGTILLPSIGVRLPGRNEYLIHLKGRYSSGVKNDAIRKVIEETQMAMIPESSNRWTNFHYRSSYFFTFAKEDEHSNKSTSFQFKNSDGSFIKTAPKYSLSVCSDATIEEDGTFSCLTTLPYSGENRTIWFNPFNASIKNTILLTEEKGFSIISDIDDTVKVSGVNNLREMVENTMFKPFKATPGMSQYYWDLYHGLSIESLEEKKKDSSSTIYPTFHFLSAIPMQFVPAIQPFLINHFPPFELLVSTLAVASGGLRAIRQIQEFKINSTHQIGRILKKKKFILIGDSTQKDPEAYGDIAREFGDRVQCIFIRIVWGFSAKKELDLNTEERFVVDRTRFC